MAYATIDPTIKIKPSSEMCSFVKTLLGFEEASCKESSTPLPTGIASLADETSFNDVIFFVDDINWIFVKNQSW